MAVFAGHQVNIVNFNFIAHKLSLGLVTVLDQSLQQSASIMFETEFGVFLTDMFYGLINEGVFFLIRDFLLFHHELIVVDSKRFD